ncbi:MAG: leucine-rich repeat domain-containing protein, partial [Treponemataceae bacterium]|nr:leucine-rich repeat domain-containing protein [Treponemataceae bacterium]
MKKTWLAALAAMMLMVGFAACQDEVPPYLVIEEIDDDEEDFHGKVVMGVTDPAEVPAHVKIPNGVAGIAYVFKDCTSIESVEIPKSVKKIGYGTFADCKNIAVVTYKGSFKDWCAVDWDSDLIRNAKRIMLSDGTDLKKLAEIAANDLTGVTKIGEYAFAGCTSIESVTIPKSVKEISYGAFASCKNIAMVTYKGSFKDWCAVDWDRSLIRYAKRIMLSDGTDPREVTEITANDLTGVTKIGNAVFAGCTSLASVTIPGSIKEIGEYVFDDCTSIESVEIPKSVKEIGYGAFTGCKNIAVVTYKGSFKDWCAVDWDRHLIRNAKRIMLSDGTD